MTFPKTECEKTVVTNLKLKLPISINGQLLIEALCQFSAPPDEIGIEYRREREWQKFIIKNAQPYESLTKDQRDELFLLFKTKKDVEICQVKLVELIQKNKKEKTNMPTPSAQVAIDEDTSQSPLPLTKEVTKITTQIASAEISPLESDKKETLLAPIQTAKDANNVAPSEQQDEDGVPTLSLNTDITSKIQQRRESNEAPTNSVLKNK